MMIHSFSSHEYMAGSQPYKLISAAQRRQEIDEVDNWLRTIDAAVSRQQRERMATKTTVILKEPVPLSLIGTLKGAYLGDEGVYKQVIFSKDGRKVTLDWSLPAANEDEDAEEEQEEKKPARRTALTHRRRRHSQASNMTPPAPPCTYTQRGIQCTNPGVYVTRGGHPGLPYCEDHRCHHCPEGSNPRKVIKNTTRCAACATGGRFGRPHETRKRKRIEEPNEEEEEEEITTSYDLDEIVVGEVNDEEEEKEAPSPKKPRLD
jgi:hypothetical protein